MESTVGKVSDVSELGLVNHASLMVSTSHALLISDPWVDGSAFNDGWDLLVPSAPPDLTADTRPLFVWYSHEHPDHFAPRWLRGLDERVKARTTVLFQDTIDHRVADFCRSAGLRTIEMADGSTHQLAADLQVTCGAVWEYDSWLLVKVPEMTLLNLNDCRVIDPDALAVLARQVGPIDILATQFSYASWKGGPEHTALRRHYADDKLRQVRRQVEALKPRWVLPFASFMYFSHAENRYMNDALNTIDATVATIEQTAAQPMVLYPGQRWAAGSIHDPNPAIACWREAFDLHTRTFRESATVARDDLIASAAAFRRHLHTFNNRLFLTGLRYAPVGGFLRPVTIGLYDYPGEAFEFSTWKGLRPTTKVPAAWMHSSSLDFIFSHGFGFDTLLVNGRFQADTDGFRRLSRAFGITVINNTGRKVGWAAINDARYFISLLRTVRNFSDNSQAAERGEDLAPFAA